MSHKDNGSARMEADEYRNIMEQFELKHAEMAEALGISERAQYGYASGEMVIPNPTAKLLRLWLQLKRNPDKLRLPAFINYQSI